MHAFKILCVLLVAAAIYQWRDYLFADAPAAASAPLAPPHRLAGPGVYFLRDYVSVRTARGVVGWAPGQQVRQCDATAPAGQCIVTDGTNAAAVEERELTRDLTEAETLRAQDAAGLAATRDTDAANARRNLAALVAEAEQINANSARLAADSAIGIQSSRLHDDPRAVSGGYYGYYSGNTYIVVPPAAASPSSPTAGAVASLRTSAPLTRPSTYRSTGGNAIARPFASPAASGFGPAGGPVAR